MKTKLKLRAELETEGEEMMTSSSKEKRSDKASCLMTERHTVESVSGESRAETTAG